MRWILERNDTNSGLRKTVVTAIADIFQEMFDHGRGNKEPGVFESGRSLESHPDHTIILNDGPSAVARVDCGVGLDREKLAIANMGIRLELNAGDYTARVRNLLAAGRIAVGDDP